jgi:uncharacterized caspase-like protein
MRTGLRNLALGALLAFAFALPAFAQFGIPFAGGVPGMAQFRATTLQLHQQRTLLYREALDELRKNPAAADVKECAEGRPRTSDELCISKPVEATAVAAPASQPAAPQATPQPVPQVAAQPTPQAAVPSPPAVVAQPAPAAMPRPEPVEAPQQAPQAAVQAALQPAPPIPAPTPRKIALLFGINGYLKPIPSLDTPVGDVEEIGKVLDRRYGYEVRIVRNATKGDIVRSLNQLAADVQETDTVVIMYAGHGYLMEETNMGYWIPGDASVKTAANWVSNSDIAKFLRAIRSAQLILVSDSCFSGSLTKEQKVSGTTVAARGQIQQKRSVVAFSSGGEEPVSDEGKDGHSIFAYYLIQLLDTSSGITPGYEIYRVVKDRVMKDYPQEPQYGAVLSAGHLEGGEYYFEPR